MVIETYLKLVVTVRTTKTKQEIINLLSTLKKTYGDEMVKRIDTTPDTQLLSSGFRLDVGKQGNIATIYPKITMYIGASKDGEVEEKKIQTYLTEIYPFVKQTIRDTFSAPDKILKWHLHYPSGDIDEVE